MFILQQNADTVRNGNEIQITEADNITLEVTGTFNATIVPETSIDRITWFGIPVTRQTTDSAGSTITQPDLYLVRSIRNLWFRARIDGYVSGTVNVKGEYA